MPASGAKTAFDASVALGALRLQSPLLLASGTWAYAVEGDQFIEPGTVGAYCLKGVTRQPRAGNPPPRLQQTPSAILNSVGLENIGIDALIAERLPTLDGREERIVVNFAGDTVEQFGEMAAMLAAAPSVDALEVNVSCPNLKEGGRSFGASAEQVARITRLVRETAPGLPIFVKLAPLVTDIVAVAAAAMENGATGLTIANCWPGMAIDARTRRPVFARISAGMSGPAIKPLTLRLVWEVHRALPDAPIIGVGGVMTGEDVAEYLLAGASAVGVGAALLASPHAAGRIFHEFAAFCEEAGAGSASSLTGALQDWKPLHDDTD